jgi:hypothetical protein
MLIQQPGDFHGRSLRRLPGSSSELTMSPSPVATVARSHLSPDGGSLPRHAYHRLAADGYKSRGLLQISRSQLPLPLGTLIRHSSHWDYSVSLEAVFSPSRSNKKTGNPVVARFVLDQFLQPYR